MDEVWSKNEVETPTLLLKAWLEKIRWKSPDQKKNYSSFIPTRFCHPSTRSRYGYTVYVFAGFQFGTYAVIQVVEYIHITASGFFQTECRPDKPKIK